MKNKLYFKKTKKHASKKYIITRLSTKIFDLNCPISSTYLIKNLCLANLNIAKH